MEYEEVITNKYNRSVSNVVKTATHFKWNLIKSDPDDNKFVDCVLSSNSNYLVTEDKDFAVLNDMNFPKIGLLNIESFEQILANHRAK